jgi:hypothetical protein
MSSPDAYIPLSYGDGLSRYGVGAWVPQPLSTDSWCTRTPPNYRDLPLQLAAQSFCTSPTFLSRVNAASPWPSAILTTEGINKSDP